MSKNRSNSDDAAALATREAAFRQAISDQDARFADRQAASEARIADLYKTAEQRAVADALEREALAVQSYKSQAVAAAVAAKEIAPAFAPLIAGDAPAEIDSAIELAKIATADIVQEISGQQQEQVAHDGLLRDQHGRFLSSQAPAEQGQLTAEDIARMSPAQVHAALNADHLGADRIGRRGQRLETDSGFEEIDWRTRSANARIFDSQLPDTRRPVPPGYMREE